MKTDAIKDLIVQTITDPATAAQRLMAMRWPTETLWMALILLTVLNTIVYMIGLWAGPEPDPVTMAMIPPAFQSPILFAVFLGGALVITVFVLQWVGQILDGRATLADMLVLIAWLQFMRLCLQVVVLVLMQVVPVLTGLLVLVASIWGMYILVVFVNEAHRFGSLFKAVGVLMLASLAMILGLSLFLGVLGAAAGGI